MSGRAHERMLWLLKRMATPMAGDFIIAWNTDTVDDFVRAFPEANRTLVVYTMGPNSSPMLNRAAKRARDLGYIYPGSIGNMDARMYNQRTWCRTWHLTDAGRHLLGDPHDAPPAPAPPPIIHGDCCPRGRKCPR